MSVRSWKRSRSTRSTRPRAIPARGLRAVEGNLEGLARGGVAVSESWHTDQGTDVGDVLKIRVAGEVLRPRVVAVFRDAPDLFAEVVAPRSLVSPGDHEPTPELVFVDPGDADLAHLLEGTDARVLTADQWIDEVDRQTRAGNNLGLWVLLGPAGLYAGIAIVNAVLVGASQRKEQERTIALLGATRRAAAPDGAVGSGAGGSRRPAGRRRRHRAGGLDHPVGDLGARGGAAVHPALAAAGSDRRHLRGPDRARSGGRLVGTPSLTDQVPVSPGRRPTA